MSLRRYLYGLILGLLLTTGLGLGAIFVFFSQQSAQQLGERLQAKTMGHVQLQLRQYMRSADRINRINESLFEQNLVSLSDDQAWAKQFNHQVQQFDGISYITVSQADGAWFALNNSQERRFTKVDAQGRVFHYPWNQDSLLTHADPLLYRYRTEDQPWFSIPVQAAKPQWSPVYSWVDPPQLAISHGIPVYRNNKLHALFSVDVSLQKISQFLRQFALGMTGGVYIVDQDMTMVASSTLHALYRRNQGAVRRIEAIDYGDVVFANVAQQLTEHERAELFGNKFSQRMQIDTERYGVLSEPFFTADGLNWLVITVVPESELMAGVYKGLVWALLAGVVLVVVSLWVAGVFANRWTRPLIRLANKVSELQWLNLNQDFHVDTDISELRELSEALSHMQIGLQSFAKYVPRDLVRQILQQGTVAQLGGEKRQVSVMFADIQGYSSAVEKAEAEQILNLLNQYFSAMQEVIGMYGGTLIEQLGDGLLVVFGAPHVLQQHALNATRCALAMQDALVELNQQWRETGMDNIWGKTSPDGLTMRIGVHSGDVIAGNIGGAEHIKYGVVGDVVNVAARLEGMNKSFSSSIAISSQVYNRLDFSLVGLFQSQGHHELKGRDQEQLIYTYTSQT